MVFSEKEFINIRGRAMRGEQAMSHLVLARSIRFISLGILLIMAPLIGIGIVQAAGSLAPTLTGKDGAPMALIPE